MKKSLRAAVKWWVCLPLVPILIALVAKYSRELFHSIGFYRLEWAASGLEILGAIALIPYMALDFAVIAPLVGPWGDPTSFPSLILVMSLPAIACCLLLYGVSLAIQIASNKPSNKSLEPTAGRRDAHI
jgi:hypothetical protein